MAENGELGLDKFNGRIQDGFFSAYLMTVGAMQGAALATLAWVCANHIKGACAEFNSAAFLMYSIMSFMIVVAVTYEFILFTMPLRWIPSPLDILFPFALGLSELLAIFNISTCTNWWLLIGLLYLFAALCFLNTIRNLPTQGMSDDQKNKIKREVWRDIALVLLVAGYCWLVCAYSPVSLDIPQALWFLLLPFFLTWCIMLKDHRFWKKFQKDLPWTN